MWLSYGMVFLWFSYDFLWHGFPLAFPWFVRMSSWVSCDVPVMFLWCSCDVPVMFLGCSCDICIVFSLRSYGFPLVFLWFPKIVTGIWRHAEAWDMQRITTPSMQWHAEDNHSEYAVTWDMRRITTPSMQWHAEDNHSEYVMTCGG